MDLGLKDKIALVAGSSRGLGYATALQLAKEGAKVAVNSRNSIKAEEAAKAICIETGAETLGVMGDVKDPAIPEQMIEKVVATWGGLDILVTNAGGPPPGSFESFDDAAWYAAIEGSLMSHVRLIRAALPYLRQSKAASVLTITSFSVKQPIPNLILSNSIRAATVGLTKTLALELGAEGIRFNSILPARMMTERIMELDSANAKVHQVSLEEEQRRGAAQSVFGRAGTPEEFARPAAFLVSPAAAYITGVMLTVDGGMYKGTL